MRMMAALWQNHPALILFELREADWALGHSDAEKREL
jgi:hypothetical protein